MLGRFIPDPTKPGQEEADAYVAEDHLSDIEQTRLALEHLRGFTATPEDCYFCVWEGYGDLNFPPSALNGPMVTIPHRRYFLFHGSLADLGSWEETSPASETSHPHSSGRLTTVGASPATSTPTGPERGRASSDRHSSTLPELDVVPAQPTEPQTHLLLIDTPRIPNRCVRERPADQR